MLHEPIQVIFVAGLDLFNRCNGMSKMLKSPFDGVVVVYRSGENTKFITHAQASTSLKIFYISNDEICDEANVHLGEISSSKIRKDSSNGNLTFPSVLDYFRSVWRKISLLFIVFLRHQHCHRNREAKKERNRARFRLVCVFSLRGKMKFLLIDSINCSNSFVLSVSIAELIWTGVRWKRRERTFRVTTPIVDFLFTTPLRSVLKRKEKQIDV